MVVSHYLHSESATAFAERWSIPWRALFTSVAGIVRIWAQRRQQRRELLDFMTIDHRAAADMGVTVNDARDWAQRPFWRA
jgi:uncharacterized protein YjiS (DUF1127 family)